MALLLPQKALDYQICSVCKKYLSCGPTKIYFNGDGGVKCGRCKETNELNSLSSLKETDPGTPSMYDKIAENVIFPCINRFEGCSVLLRYNDTLKHEKTCIGEMYKCPLCDEDKYMPNSLLYLLNHYKVTHEKSILTKPEFHLQYNLVEDSFVYYDNSENLFVIILVQFDGTNLCVGASTVGNRIDKVKYRIRILVDGLEKLKTKLKQCTGFNEDIFHLECNELFDNSNLLDVLCVIDFDTSQISKYQILLSEGNSNSIKSVSKKTESVILPENYGTDVVPCYEDANFEKKFPQIYFTKDLALKVSLYEDNFILKCTKIQYVSFNPCYHIFMFCNFCENYFVPSIKQHYCSTDSYIVCPSCFKNGVSKCFWCKETFEQAIRPICSDIYYYCGFGCSKFFNWKEIEVHEKNCNLNKEKSLTNSELGRLYFDKYYVESSAESKTFLVRSNAVLLDRNIIGQKGKIYLISDCLKCIVFYKIEKDVYRFQVAHNYSPKKYYVLIKVVNDEETMTCPNNFTLKNSFKTCYFAVILQETKEKNFFRELTNKSFRKLKYKTLQKLN